MLAAMTSRTLLTRLLALHVLAALPAAAQEAPMPTVAQPRAQPVPAAPATIALSPREAAVTVLGSYTCDLEEHDGIDRDDAVTTGDVVCHALDAHHAAAGAYDIRLGKLGTRLLFVIAQRETGDERRLFINGIEEVPIAADRLVDALVTGKKFDETLKVDNVVSAEARVPLRRDTQVSMFMGLSAITALGIPSSPSSGISLGLDFRVQNLALELQGHAGGIGSDANLLGYATASIGGRYYLSDADTAGFVGGGISLAYFQSNQQNGPNYTGSGLAGYGELGVAFLRASRIGALAALRADLPMFSFTQAAEPGWSGGSVYAVPISIDVGLLFH
jgi:hypothetical protein